jgi:shikimate kinase
MTDNYVLIGYMGSGKTTIGRELSKRTGSKLFDMDQMIEERAGKSIASVFSEDGEEVFRKMETSMLEELAGSDDSSVLRGRVYSVGGGTPMREENRRLLKEIGRVIWLSVEPETVMCRLSHDHSRPLLNVADREKKVRNMIAERAPLYKETADHVVKVDGLMPSQIVDIILELK